MTKEEADAIIDSALLSAQNGGATAPPSSTASGTTEESGAIPGPLPTDGTVTAPPPLTKEEKESARIRKAQEDLLGKEQAKAIADEQSRQKARQATVMGIAEKYLARGKNAANTANVKIGGIPTPGNLVVPFLLLLLFFFILITYNGNTRFQWAWLVLTNNASVSATSQTGNSTSTNTPHFGGGPDNTQAVLVSAATLTAHKGSGMYGSPF